MKRLSALHRNILLYRLLLVFGANGLMTSVIYFFFTLSKGLSVSQVLFLVGLSTLAKAIFEVPTGVVADKFSRKYSILIGYTIILLSWFGIIFAQGFWPLLLLIVITGVGSSFISGADDALLYDSLKELGQENRFKQVVSFSESIELVAFAITILVGGFLGNINIYWPVVLNLAFLFFSIFVANLLIEPIITKEGEKIEHIGYFEHSKRSFRTVFSQKGYASGLLTSFISLALILAVFKSTKNILSPVLSQYDLRISTIGVIISGVILIKAIGAFITSKISKHGREIREVLTSLGICIAGLILIATIQVSIIQLLIFIFIVGLDNLILTNLNALINANIYSKERSTILSLSSLLARSTEMLFLTSFGWIIDMYQINIALFFTAVWLMVALFVQLLFQTKITKALLHRN